MGNSAAFLILPIVFAVFSLAPMAMAYGKSMIHKSKKSDASVAENKSASNNNNPIIIEDDGSTIKLNLKNKDVQQSILEQLSSLRDK
ncbi:hypothetical protein KRX19_05510 [Cardiobacteriaceae bacterium TAE3-ERU3]|nr:hypothetical protein [Cardiobacteriaceae bacterium TAE3-ERU3]